MRAWQAALAAWLGLSALSASAQDARWCERACRRPAAPSGATRVVVDANTAQLLDGSADLPDGASVWLVFAGKNPFKYTYRFAVTSQSLDAATAQVVLSRILGQTGIGATAASLPFGGPQEKSLPGFRSATCGAILRLNQLVEESVALATSVSRPAAYVDRYARFFEATSSDDAFTDERACVARCKEALEMRSTRGDREVAGVAERIEQLAKGVEAASAALDGQGCSTTDREQAAKAGTVDQLRSDAAGYRAKLGEVTRALATQAAGIAALDRVLDQVVGDDSAFNEGSTPATSGEPAAVRAELRRKAVRAVDAPEQMVGAVELRVGRGWLSLSGGVMASWLTQRKVVRQTGNVAAPGQAPQAGLVFAYEEDSNMTVAPLLLLTANVYDLCPYATAGLSLGVIASAASGGGPIEYFGGVTLALVRRRVFVSGGVHLGQREALAGGFQIGQQIPANVTDPLPTRRSWMTSAAVAVTFALR